jgi:cytochrome b subunit of formate dehydrogenase
LNARAVRRGLHLVHAGSALFLLATGVLLAAPDLRARLVGGYGRQLASSHDVGAWAFLLAPALAIALAARPLARDLRARLGPPPEGPSWQKVHIVLSLVLSLLLAASGVALWNTASLTGPWYDVALETHVAASWALGVAIPLHLVAARRKLVARAREILAGGPDPRLLDPPD